MRRKSATLLKQATGPCMVSHRYNATSTSRIRLNPDFLLRQCRLPYEACNPLLPRKGGLETHFGNCASACPRVFGLLSFVSCDFDIATRSSTSEWDDDLSPPPVHVQGKNNTDKHGSSSFCAHFPYQFFHKTHISFFLALPVLPLPLGPAVHRHTGCNLARRLRCEGRICICHICSTACTQVSRI